MSRPLAAFFFTSYLRSVPSALHSKNPAPTANIRAVVRVEYEHRVFFTRDLFSPSNRLLPELLQGEQPGKPPRIVVAGDANLFETQRDLSERIQSRLATGGAELVSLPILLPGGEEAKNDPSLVTQVHQAIHDGKLSRHSFVIAVGGGAILDLVGFAAATAHRGIRHIRIPTTTLSQGDGGVGVKNGVNAFGKKNFLGTFAPPYAVVNDLEFLHALPERPRRSGFAEAVKVGLIRDLDFFQWLEREAENLANFEEAAIEQAIQRSATLHVAHIAGSGDPFEMGSARPLDFGHWSAHKLEQMSGFRLTHGEAVAIGIGIDVLYSSSAGFLDDAQALRVIALLQSLGFEMDAPELTRVEELLAGLEEFREHLGGRLTITLLRAPGEGFEVHEMDPTRIRDAIARLRTLA